MSSAGKRGATNMQ